MSSQHPNDEHADSAADVEQPIVARLADDGEPPIADDSVDETNQLSTTDGDGRGLAETGRCNSARFKDGEQSQKRSMMSDLCVIRRRGRWRRRRSCSVLRRWRRGGFPVAVRSLPCWDAACRFSASIRKSGWPPAHVCCCTWCCS